ncbi:uncharacterized protein [Medicago truncatula]|uniref:uncharacterized protein n=1 Tax=Medicago truncatula TaxID=3880 RepID=UPI0019679093|nr:uncharacterized protein LOC120579983 [Medicago truncatula]
MGRYNNYFSDFDVKVWLHEMTKGTSAIFLITRVWYTWCWRNNTIFYGQHWCIQDVVRKIFLLHDECISYYPNLGLDPHSSHLLAHWILHPEGTLKINIDDSFLEDWIAGGGVRNHDGDWIAGFSHYEAGGDALLAELRAIRIGLDFCNLKGYVNIICESDCLKAVDLIIDGRDHTLHTYATDILHIRDVLHGNGNTTLMHVLREQNMCKFYG